jgi:hypothetical protein
MRWAVQGLTVAALLSSLVSCGGDSDAGTVTGPNATPCTPGKQSTPGAAGDPCPQTGTQCASVGGRAVGVCTMMGTWPSAAVAGSCTCLQGPLNCGNGIFEPAMMEQCDGMLLNGGTCMSLGMGMGMLMCDPVTCTYNTSMCGATGTAGDGYGSYGSY